VKELRTRIKVGTIISILSWAVKELLQKLLVKRKEK